MKHYIVQITFEMNICAPDPEQAELRAMAAVSKYQLDIDGIFSKTIAEIDAEITEQPKNNADRIRQMTDDEELLSAIGTNCYRCIYNNGECGSRYGEGCLAGNLAWLKQEVNKDE